MKIIKLISLFTILCAGFSQTALATDTTTGNASYVGHLHDGTLFDEVTLTNGADWFNLYMVAGQLITVNITRGDVGNLIPNVSVFNGEALPGQTIADAGLVEQFYSPYTNSNTSSSFKQLIFTPTVTGVWTLIVTTWTGQQGTYDITCSGCGNMPMADEVPEPGILALLVSGLFGAFILRRRKFAK